MVIQLLHWRHSKWLVWRIIRRWLGLMLRNIRERNCWSLRLICCRRLRNIYRLRIMWIIIVIKEENMMMKKGNNIWMFINQDRSQGRRHQLNVSKLSTRIIMIYKKKTLLKTLSFPNICKLNCRPMNPLIKNQQSNLEKRHSTRLFLQVRLKENTVWRRPCCTRKCWKQTWFSAV